MIISIIIESEPLIKKLKSINCIFSPAIILEEFTINSGNLKGCLFTGTSKVKRVMKKLKHII